MSLHISNLVTQIIAQSFIVVKQPQSIDCRQFQMCLTVIPKLDSVFISNRLGCSLQKLLYIFPCINKLYAETIRFAVTIFLL